MGFVTPVLLGSRVLSTSPAARPDSPGRGRHLDRLFFADTASTPRPRASCRSPRVICITFCSSSSCSPALLSFFPTRATVVPAILEGRNSSELCCSCQSSDQAGLGFEAGVGWRNYPGVLHRAAPATERMNIESIQQTASHESTPRATPDAPGREEVSSAAYQGRPPHQIV